MKMKRTLVLRFIALEVGPMIAAAAISALTARLSFAILAAAALAILINVTLSIRDGSVLAHGGRVCEKNQEGGWFWFWSPPMSASLWFSWQALLASQ